MRTLTAVMAVAASAWILSVGASRAAEAPAAVLDEGLLADAGEGRDHDALDEDLPADERPAVEEEPEPSAPETAVTAPSPTPTPPAKVIRRRNTLGGIKPMKRRR